MHSHPINSILENTTTENCSVTDPDPVHQDKSICDNMIVWEKNLNQHLAVLFDNFGSFSSDQKSSGLNLWIGGSRLHCV
jgi:hypothetical protein